MPELPEVETIKNALIPHLVGSTISRVQILWPKAVKGMSVEAFTQMLSGRRITSIRRRGKYLLFDVSSGEVLGIHLRMTGVLLLHPLSIGPGKHTRAIFYLNDDTVLHFVDQRKPTRRLSNCPRALHPAPG